MKEVKVNKEGIEYLHAVIHEKPLVVTRASLWKIPHPNSGIQDISLKIGRYSKKRGPFDLDFEHLESSTPKSELTLTGEEFSALIQFLENQYEPFKSGVGRFIPLDEPFDKGNIEHLQAFFRHPEKQELVEFIFSNGIIPEEFFLAFNHISKRRAIDEFEGMLDEDLLENQ